MNNVLLDRHGRVWGMIMRNVAGLNRRICYPARLGLSLSALIMCTLSKRILSQVRGVGGGRGWGQGDGYTT
jgi:hypothetical protein